MSIKVMAIGNRIMSDDGIGIQVIEYLKEKLEHKNIEVIIGETDVDYCLSVINDNDMVFIVDSSSYNIEPGTIKVVNINNEEEPFEKGYSQHQLSLIKLLNNYKLKNIKGYVIGIEVFNIEFGDEISDVLKNKFNNITSEVYNIIISKRGEINEYY